MQGLKTNKQKHLIPEAFDLAGVTVLKGESILLLRLGITDDLYF